MRGSVPDDKFLFLFFYTADAESPTDSIVVQWSQLNPLHNSTRLSIHSIKNN